MQIGSRYNVKCMNISTLNSREILWSDKIKYLGIDLIAARVFKCSYDNAKRKFYRAFNAIFGKVGRTASEEVIIQLLKTKCLPVLYYGLEACPVNRDQARSLNRKSSLRFDFHRRSLTLVSSATVGRQQELTVCNPTRCDNEGVRWYSLASWRVTTSQF